MSMAFGVLASGSCGNVSVLRAGGRTLLFDLGLAPQSLARRLRALGSGWHEIDAVLLTHTHGDHWRDLSLRILLERRIPFHCHEHHRPQLAAVSRTFAALADAGLVQSFRFGDQVDLGAGVRYRPVALPHDGGATCGFRVETPHGTLGYASDLGTWDERHVEALTDVDILALEFNHDVELERRSNRPRYLIARVLGDAGHLSNEQAARLVHAVLERSEPGRLQHLVQLHLSRDCNRPHLAKSAVQAMLNEVGVELSVHTARQDRPGPWLRVGTRADTMQPTPQQGWLPGWEGG